jgi:hypothetical protein
VGSTPTGITKINIMSREELLAFLRENLTIEVSLDDEYEGDGRYATSNVSLRLCGEEISSSYSSVKID